MLQANIGRAKKRIQSLIDQDNDSDKQLNEYYAECMVFIKANLMTFYAKYAKDNQLSVSEVGQSASSWDTQQWINAIKQVNMKNWPDEAINRVKAYGHIAGISTLHTIEALMALGIIKMTVKNQNIISDRITKDGNDQIKIIESMVKTNPSADKKATSIITQQSTHDIWSKNLWIDSDSLANDIQTLVNKHLKHGMSINNLDDILETHANKNQFKPTKYVGDRVKQMEFNARRIVRTESSRLIDQVNTVTYSMSGITDVDVVNQPGACQKCIGLAGTYKIDNAPSIPDSSHPNCRCYKIPSGDSHSRLITVNRIF
ncbi:hypothetical protein [Apilactobacillus timberlakei]|uniref:Phage Mu protein F like protein n=1 Tax=Apilactobacillus timberlakei TaxID=2008380 RepID=A0ABY2YSL6_9LACO|nr:hypothetical protein [Apilactobacillus timberlakei]TPR12746.1 hypothetical protein DY048_06970 [Apilactobacillus timberlakei]TPR13629.1 hypothetical protein DY052_07840 [Apilactobacillus timberlakei]